MGRFVQLHLLTSYPPANLNRDDLGRPKTAKMGGAERLRVSSQSLKRAWRTSEVFESAVKGHIGTRTKEKGVQIYQSLRAKDVTEKKALDWAKSIAAVFGKSKSLSKKEEAELKAAETPEEKKEALKMKPLEIEQLAHFSPEENTLIDELIAKLAEQGEAPQADDLALLRKKHTGVDIALFGRMLASSPAFNTEAAAQVAHAISVHKVAVEDDFFTAVDDLNNGENDMGAAHMGETEFGAALFYQYICIDKESLKETLSDDVLTKDAIGGLIEAAATVSPTGKQNSFASRARASYIMCEVGGQQPRSLSVAFLKPVTGTHMLNDAIKVLENTKKNMDTVYGQCSDRTTVMNAVIPSGSLKEIIAAAVE
jgi:CRISPR system Cascade subunit CasC